MPLARFITCLGWAKSGPVAGALKQLGLACRQPWRPGCWAEVPPAGGGLGAGRGAVTAGAGCPSDQDRHHQPPGSTLPPARHPTTTSAVIPAFLAVGLQLREQRRLARADRNVAKNSARSDGPYLFYSCSAV